MKKNLIHTLLIYLVLAQINMGFAWAEDVFNSGSDNTKTIKELKENIKSLNTAKNEFKTKWEEFRSENGKINDFMVYPMTPGVQKEIEDLLTTYYTNLEKIEKNIEEKAKNLEDVATLKQELLLLKLDLYKKFVPYIQKEKANEYINYIRGNITLEKDEKALKEEIYRKEGLVEIKVANIKERIEENNKKLELRIQEAVKQRLDEKINNILQNEKFNTLPQDSQIQVFESTLKKVEEKKSLLLQIETKTTIIQKKIEIYSIVEERINNVIITLK